MFSVTRGLDRSKDPRPFKSYLDMICSLVHGSREVPACGFREKFPLTQGPLATFPRTGDHNLPSSLGQEGPPLSICPQVIPPPPTYTHSLPSSRFTSGPGQTGCAEGKMASHELLSHFPGPWSPWPTLSYPSIICTSCHPKESKDENMQDHIYELSPLFPHASPPSSISHCPRMVHPLITAAAGPVLFFALGEKWREKELLLASEL